jgi:hypothetical protein
MSPDEADRHALRLVAAIIADDDEIMRAVGQEVGTEPQDLLMLLYAVAGMTAAVYQRHGQGRGHLGHFGTYL